MADDEYTLDTDKPDEDKGIILEGTGYAAPHIAGEVGLILAANPDLKPEEVREILRSSADEQPDGSKTLDYKRAVELAIVTYGRPSTPTHVVGTLIAGLEERTTLMNDLIGLIIAENPSLEGKYEAICDILYNASEPPQKPSQYLNVWEINADKLIKLAEEYEPSE